MVLCIHEVTMDQSHQHIGQTIHTSRAIQTFHRSIFMLVIQIRCADHDSDECSSDVEKSKTKKKTRLDILKNQNTESTRVKYTKPII